MTTRTLPAGADIGQLRSQAKDLRRAVAGGNPVALARLREVRPDVDPADCTLRDAQLVVAREYGFDGWHDLVTKVGTDTINERDLHRWFGIELNNGTWDLLEGLVTPDSPIGDREQALYGAYAATYHWMQVGTAANHCRGEYLIHAAAIAVGLPDVALRHALRCAELAAAHPDLVTLFDRACAAEGLARGYAATGDLATAAIHLATARELTGQASPEDRTYLDERLAAEPWYGLSVD
jgi:hypothetical protein